MRRGVTVFFMILDLLFAILLSQNFKKHVVEDIKFLQVTAVAEGCSPFNVSTYFDVKTGCDRQRHFTQAYVNNSSQACSISFEGTGESANVTFYVRLIFCRKN